MQDSLRTDVRRSALPHTFHPPCLGGNPGQAWETLAHDTCSHAYSTFKDWVAYKPVRPSIDDVWPQPHDQWNMCSWPNLSNCILQVGNAQMFRNWGWCWHVCHQPLSGLISYIKVTTLDIMMFRLDPLCNLSFSYQHLEVWALGWPCCNIIACSPWCTIIAWACRHCKCAFKKKNIYIYIYI